MLRSIKLGSAFGIPLFIHWSFLLLPAWAAFVNRQEGMAGILFSQAVLLSLFGCVLLHELGHALMARFFGIPTRDITLYPIGGVARLESAGHSPFQEVCIALAGPAVNLLIVLVLLPFATFYLASGLFRASLVSLQAATAAPLPMAATFLFTLWAGNLVLLLFNLVPAFPMDGGRVLRGVLAWPLGLVRATEIAALVALVFAVLMAILGVHLGNPVLVFVALVVAYLGQLEAHVVRRAEARARLQAVPAALVVHPDFPLADRSLHPRLARFTGYWWDHQRGVWVRWVNGQPIDAG